MKDFRDDLKKTLIEQRNQQREDSFEEDRVRFLLKALKLEKSKSDLLKVGSNLAGRPILFLSVFSQCFPTFPFLLGASRLKVAVHKDANCNFPALFQNFRNAPFVKAYEELYERISVSDRSVGLIFPRNRIQQGLIIHNDEEIAKKVEGMTLTLNTKGKFLFVQPFASVINSIYNHGHGWKADITHF